MDRQTLSPLDQARIAALRGDLDEALPQLAALAKDGNDSASASLAELLAYLGRWDELIEPAMRLVANPLCVYAGNVLADMSALVRRAGRETGAWRKIATLADAAHDEVTAYLERNDEGFHPIKLKSLQETIPRAIDNLGYDAINAGRTIDATKRTRKPNIASMNAALKHNRRGMTDTRRMIYAHVFAVEDELMRLAEKLGDAFEFDPGLGVAEVLLRRGQPDAAWRRIETCWPHWMPVDKAQVAPVVLVTDPDFSPLITPERGEALLRRPRAAYIWS